MEADPQVLRRGKNRARIAGLGMDSADAQAIESWLRQRPDVVRFDRRKSTGEFDIAFDDGNALAGRLLRALEDRLGTLRRPKRSEPFGLQPAHSLPGRVRVRVKGLHLEQLAALTVQVSGLMGVTRAEYSPESSSALIFYDAAKVSEERILEFLRETEPANGSVKGVGAPQLRWGAAVSDTASLLSCLSRAVPFPLLATWIAVNTLRPLRRCLESLSEGTISIDLLDVAATFAALATGRPITAAFVLWMVGVGDLLLDISARQARSAMASLIRQGEREALRLRGSKRVERIPVEALHPGDKVVVPTGHAIVADGTIVSGSAEVDEQALTGESALVVKEEGDPVLASTVLAEGQVVVEVESSGKDTEAAKIEAVLQSIGTKPLTLQRDALAFAGRLVLPTFGVAGLAAAWGADVTRGVSVLITDFGTGIRIAVPTCAMTAVALAAREGVLVKGAQYLERLSKTDVIIFDKTGTLTQGVPEVVEVVPKKGFKKSTLIALAASAEAHYEHPVAKALTAYARLKQIPLLQPEVGSEDYAVGKGVSARIDGRRVRVGKASWMKSQDLKLRALKRDVARLRDNQVSVLCVAVGREVVGVIGYSDGTRPEAARIVEKLSAGGKRKAVLLSGDNPDVVASVAREVGVDDAVGGLLPQQKADYVQRLQAAGHVVAMIGDGVNDAPALASADVGISIAGSTPVALEAADVVLLDGGLVRLEHAFRISDQAMRKVRQNLGMIIVPNAVGIALGALGLITPPMAAIINNGATILAVLVSTVPLLLGSLPERSAERATADPGHLA
jgi:Cu2+-exporting ATPase